MNTERLLPKEKHVSINNIYQRNIYINNIDNQCIFLDYREERIVQIEETIFKPNQKSCSTSIGDLCTKLCNNVGNKFGKCNSESQNVQCLCSKDKSTWTNYLDIETHTNNGKS